MGEITNVAKVARVDTSPRLGKSQEVVLNHIRANPGLTAQEIGNGLYNEHSSCAAPSPVDLMGFVTAPDKLRRRWAYQVCRALEKRGLIKSVMVMDERAPAKGRRPRAYTAV